MAIEVTLHLQRGGPVTVTFEDGWEFKDTDRVVLLLDSERRVRGGANLTNYSHLTVRDADGERG